MPVLSTGPVGRSRAGRHGADPPDPGRCSGRVEGHVHESRLPGSQVPVYLIDQPGYFDRDGLYGNGVNGLRR